MRINCLALNMPHHITSHKTSDTLLLSNSPYFYPFTSTHSKYPDWCAPKYVRAHSILYSEYQMKWQTKDLHRGLVLSCVQRSQFYYLLAYNFCSFLFFHWSICCRCFSLGLMNITTFRLLTHFHCTTSVNLRFSPFQLFFSCVLDISPLYIEMCDVRVCLTNFMRTNKSANKTMNEWRMKEKKANCLGYLLFRIAQYIYGFFLFVCLHVCVYTFAIEPQ